MPSALRLGDHAWRPRRARLSWITLHFSLTGRGLRTRRYRERRGGGSDYSREAIISNISVQGGRVIIRGRRLIEGRLLFEEIR